VGEEKIVFNFFGADFVPYVFVFDVPSATWILFLFVGTPFFIYTTMNT